MSPRVADVYLAALPCVDVVLNQIGNLGAITIWGLSVFQAVRGGLLVVSLALLAHELRRCDRRTFRDAAVVFLYPLALTFATVVEVASRSTLEAETVVALLQSFYWVAVLALVLTRVDHPGSRVIENGLLVAGSVAAASVLIVFVLRGAPENAYQIAGVDASWGWFFTMKGLTGQLLVAGIVAAMVARTRGARWAYGVAAAAVAATFLTYARTGQVALAVALLWLFLTRSRKSPWALAREVAVVGAVVAIALSVPRVQPALADNLSLRWRDVIDEGMRDQGKAGSGRANLLPDSWRAFASGGAVDVVVGRGFAGMRDAVDQAGYSRMHTHNDLLDLLLATGFLGFLAMTWLVATAWRRLKAAGGQWRYSLAIWLVWGVHGALTGQLWLPDAMAWYGLGLGAVAASGRRAALPAISMTAVAGRERERPPREDLTRTPAGRNPRQ
jgi:hypothetical protein